MVKIAPSVLGADFWHLREQVEKVEQSGAEYLHLDIMDGAFVPNISFGPSFVKAIRPHSKLFFDAHLMVKEPGRFIEDFIDAGVDLITVHAEACHHLNRTVQEIKEKGIKVGVSLNPATPLVQLEEILPELDLVLLMSVNPGFCGQKFITSTLDKTSRLKSMIREKRLATEIEVDGGVSKDNAAAIVKAGADVLVSGSSVFSALDIIKAIDELRSAAMAKKI